ncbi:hypothetical protein [Mycolicibacterium hippocampi]|uniref:hypothetical protein n=1 Tax=Mycolicibacterium hippocampi TaxID=659824 RepID=UPI00351138D8
MTSDASGKGFNFQPNDDVGRHAAWAEGVVEDVELLEYDGPSIDVEGWIESKNTRDVPFLHYYRRTSAEDRQIEGWLLFLPHLRQADRDWFRVVPNPACSFEDAQQWSQDYLRDHYRHHPEARPKPQG